MNDKRLVLQNKCSERLETKETLAKKKEHESSDIIIENMKSLYQDNKDEKESDYKEQSEKLNEKKVQQNVEKTEENNDPDPSHQ